MSKFTVRATGIAELDRVQYAIRAGFDLLEQQLSQVVNGGTVPGIPGGGGANPFGYFVVTQAKNAPINAANLGLLTPGLLQITVSGGVATISTTTVTGGITQLTGQVVAGPGSGSQAATVVIPATLLPLGDGSNHMTTDGNLSFTGGNTLHTPFLAVNSTVYSVGSTLNLYSDLAGTGLRIVIGSAGIQEIADVITFSSDQRLRWDDNSGVNTGGLLSIGLTPAFGSGAAMQINTEDTYISLGASVKAGLWVASSYPQYSSIVADMGYFGASIVGYYAQAMADLVVAAGGANILHLGYGGDSGPGPSTGVTDVITIDGTAAGSCAIATDTIDVHGDTVSIEADSSGTIKGDWLLLDSSSATVAHMTTVGLSVQRPLLVQTSLDVTGTIGGGGGDVTIDPGANSLLLGGASMTLAFFGGSPAGQSTGGSATAGVVYTAIEQAMLQKAYDCLRTFHLLS